MESRQPAFRPPEGFDTFGRVTATPPPGAGEPPDTLPKALEPSGGAPARALLHFPYHLDFAADAFLS